MTSKDTRVTKVLKRLEVDPAHSISSLAHFVGLSTSRLGHLFKEETGTNLAQYLDTNRMARAADLLQTTNLRIKEITFLVGYQHHASFDRAFSRTYRCTPKRFRLENQKLPKFPV